MLKVIDLAANHEEPMHFVLIEGGMPPKKNQHM